MSLVRTEEIDDTKSLCEKLKEDFRSEFIDELAARLTQSMDQIQIAQLNCEDDGVNYKLAQLYDAAALCKEELTQLWSDLHLRNRA